MYPMFFVVAWSLVLCHMASAASGADWRSRSIYQVLTDRFARTDGSTTAPCDTGDRIYCGGTFKGIQNHLDYIQGMEFDSVWISPITAQLKGNTAYGYAYHGYWQQDLYEINPQFGTAEDLKSLSGALHSRGMYLMVDIVVNHNGWSGPPSSVDYGVFNPFDKKSDYHQYCAIDFDNIDNNTNIKRCWFGDQKVPLPDLATENPRVASGYQHWIGQLVSNYSIDGLRLDTVMEVNTGFWSGFLRSAGIYAVGEVAQSDADYVCNYQNYVPGLLNYATYFPLVAAFESTSGNISALADAINAVKSDCTDTSLLGSFSENHDQPRFAYLTSDLALAENVITYTMLADGIPIIYEGQEQHYAALGGSSTGGNDPYNREAVWFSGYNTTAPLYELITTLNKARKQAIDDDSTYLKYQNFPIYTDATTIAVRKGKMVSVLSNKGVQGAAYTQSVPAGYAAGTTVTEILTCATLTANSKGNIVVPMAKGQPRIYYPTSGLAGSGLCGSSSRKAGLTLM